MTVKYITVFIIMVLLSKKAFNQEEDDDTGPLVKTDTGLVRGRFATSFTGQRYASFQGIPYAYAPMGNLRFKAPKPVEPWEGELNAIAPGPDCPQVDPLSGSVVGEEDCLTLNIYTTQLEGKPQPVLVWIHGGSFINGSGRLYQPDVLLDQGLVVVTLNYRLGALGFLRVPQAGVPGNMGLRDQSLALLWLHRNIAAFGGDASCVTLAGQSAGAACVIFHMLSPLSQGLFNRALSMSGSALCWWALPPNPEQRSLRLLRAAGLPVRLNPEEDADAPAVAEFLAGPKAEPAAVVPRYREALDPEERVEAMMPVLGPCVEQEGDDCGPPFLLDEPMRLLAAGRFQRVPLLAGLTDGEAKFFLLYGGLGSMESLQAFDKGFDDFFSPMMDAALTSRIRNFYFGIEPITEKLLINITNMLSDVHVLEPVERTLRMVALQSVPAYLYLLSHQPRHSFWGTPLSAIENLGVPGVPHGEDLAVMFPLVMGEPPEDRRVPEDDWVRLYFATAVANFARTGNPVPKTNKFMKEKWAPFTVDHQNFMNISSSPKLQHNIMADRIEFWRKLLGDLATKTANQEEPKDPSPAAATMPVQCFLKIFICSLMIAAFFQ